MVNVWLDCFMSLAKKHFTRHSKSCSEEYYVILLLSCYPLLQLDSQEVASAALVSYNLMPNPYLTYWGLFDPSYVSSIASATKAFIILWAFQVFAGCHYGAY